MFVYITSTVLFMLLLKCTENMLLNISSSKQSNFQLHWLKKIFHFFFILLDISNSGYRDRSPIRPERQAGRGRGRGRGRGARRGARSGPARRRQDPAEQYSPVQIPDFGEPHPGPTRRFPNVNTARERDFFDLLFTNDIWEILVQETNRYYDQQKPLTLASIKDPGLLSREMKWRPSLVLLF